MGSPYAHEYTLSAYLRQGDNPVFNSTFLKDSNFDSLRPNLEAYRDWYIELRGRRDPAAHRIPLYVPPSILVPEAGSRYEALQSEIHAALKDGDFEKIENLENEQQQIGTFVPIFQHHPMEEFIYFYPTIPQDVGNLIKISYAVFELLSAKNPL